MCSAGQASLWSVVRPGSPGPCGISPVVPIWLPRDLDSFRPRPLMCVPRDQPDGVPGFV